MIEIIGMNIYNRDHFHLDIDDLVTKSSSTSYRPLPRGHKFQSNNENQGFCRINPHSMD